jgi:uncharacterized membrane protein
MSGTGGSVGTVEQSVEVAAPVSAVYDRWTRFEEFPKFTESIEDLTQLDETHLRWRMRIGDEEREFDAEIIEQRPYERICWRSMTGAGHTGTVTFERVDEAATRIVMRLELGPDGRFERAADASAHARLLQGDLHRFKALLEAAPARANPPR